jgi:hypothetical protein
LLRVIDHEAVLLDPKKNSSWAHRPVVLLKRRFGRQTCSRWRFSRKVGWIVRVAIRNRLTPAAPRRCVFPRRLAPARLASDPIGPGNAGTAYSWQCRHCVLRAASRRRRAALRYLRTRGASRAASRGGRSRARPPQNRYTESERRLAQAAPAAQRQLAGRGREVGARPASCRFSAGASCASRRSDAV